MLPRLAAIAMSRDLAGVVYVFKEYVPAGIIYWYLVYNLGY